VTGNKAVDVLIVSVAWTVLSDKVRELIQGDSGGCGGMFILGRLEKQDKERSEVRRHFPLEGQPEMADDFFLDCIVWNMALFAH
jgi:hypothetical protein